MTLSTRLITEALVSLGCDPSSTQPDLNPGISPVYVFGDQRFSIAHRGSAKLYMNTIPSTAAAQFSAVEIVSQFGMWIRRALNNGPSNMTLGFHQFGGVSDLTGAIDPAPAVTFVTPEGSPFVSRDQLTSNPLGGAGGASGSPPLFTWCNQGRRVAAFANGVFIPASPTRDFLIDVWVPPFVAVEVCSVTANTVINVNWDLEFPAASIGF